MLLRAGTLTDDVLADVLAEQRRGIPLGSLCYVLGHLDEATLASALSRQLGVPAIVLDRSIIRLDVLQAVSRETALRHGVLPVFADDQRIFVAAEDPRQVTEILREIRFVTGKTPVPHVSLHVTLARTIRACFAAWDRGERFWAGPWADPSTSQELGVMVVVADVDSNAEEVRVSPVAESAVEDVTRELDHYERRMLDAPGEDTSTTDAGTTIKDVATRPVRAPTLDGLADIPAMAVSSAKGPVLDLDAGEGADYLAGHTGPKRIQIVDDDFATRHLLVKVLQPLGILTSTSATGSEAIRQLKANPPDVVILDVMLPEMDGFQICRAIKQSRKYNHISVILMSAVIESSRVTDELLSRYGASAYFQKPLDTDKIKECIQGLVMISGPSAAAGEDDRFDRAIALYKTGDINGAIELLRQGLEVDPLSAKHHFVLANLLQKKSLAYEAIAEYEATVELKPDYFPALTRLAYLYYRKGFAARAVDVWRRALPHCPDRMLRQNIENFVARLTAEP